MHITILADSIDNQKAGVHNFTKELISSLLTNFPENRYSFIHQKKNDFFNSTEHYIVKRPNHPGSDTIRKFIKIPRLINKVIKPDIVIEPCHIGPFGLSKHIKKVLVVHDLTPLLYPEFHTFRGVLGHKLFFKKSITNADLIISPSKTTRNDLLKLFTPKSKVEVVPLGVKPQPATKKSKNNKPYLLYLGTIEPRKNIQNLINSFLELKEEIKLPHHLIISGEMGWKYQKIKKAAKHKDVIFTGFVDEIKKKELFQNADLFIYPSFYEGFGLPVLEAMSYGTPVICSNGGSLREYFKNKAIMFNPYEKNELKEKISSLVFDISKKNNLKNKGLDYAKKFTWKKTAEELLAAIQEIY